MRQEKVLIANRGEVAIRIARSAFELGIATVAVFSEDDVEALHRWKADESYALKGAGATAYLDGKQLIALAHASDCTLIHPGYGFLSENGAFARRCKEENLIFVGPSAKNLERLGDKVAARRLAEAVGVPILPGTSEATTLAEANHFLGTLAAGEGLMLKALFGGGGRGMRLVHTAAELVAAWEGCRAEARLAFGRDELYVERWLPHARHIEVQVIGDGTGAVSHLYERECSIQRRHQKLIEIAPAPDISTELRDDLISAALRLAQQIAYDSLGTFEFLIEGSNLSAGTPFYFIEANPRLQVEHTITEEITGIDLVNWQLQVALGQSLEEIGAEQAAIPQPRGYAMQLRLNMETIDAQGKTRPTTGRLTTFDLPTGHGIRTETSGIVGYQPSPRFDSLLAKIIAHSTAPDFSRVVQKAYRALCETSIEGIQSNLTFLQNILQHSAFTPEQLHTRFVEAHLPALIAESKHQPLFMGSSALEKPAQRAEKVAKVAPAGTTPLISPMPGSLISLEVEVAQQVGKGQAVALIEAMKMETVIRAPVGGLIHTIAASVGDILADKQAILFIEPSANAASEHIAEQQIDLDAIRPDLADVFARRRFGLDENRPEAVAKRRKKGQLTARENIANLCDAGTFTEYGSALIAAQRTRRSVDDLIRRTPADGLITGIGTVNGTLFGKETRCMIMAYDYTVLAGTQGMLNHKKMDRLFHLVEEWQIPLILFAEGGGGRPGDVDHVGVAGLDVMTFAYYASLSGQVPRVTIVSGYCFAGNAALAGSADVLIVTQNSSIGMGGPVMIEGGGLGRYHPKEVGPADMQYQNGVIDILVKDEAEAARAAKKYLSYFQGAIEEWTCADQRQLRRLIPENRRRMYDICALIETLADTESVLELRAGFGNGIITALIRIEGQPLGLIANNPAHLGGAIDSDGADKAARFMQLCDAFGLPILALVDTPGIMVGPDAEKTGTVRHAARLFVTGATLSVPYFAIILRKGYGLGAQAMCGGSFHLPFFTIAWPTGEFGAMGLEGAVRLGYRKELAAAESPEAQQKLFEKLVAQLYEQGKALNMASFMELDEVIDPLESRHWIITGLKTAAQRGEGRKKKRRFVDTW